MAGNRAVAYAGPGRVTVETIDYPKLELQDGPGVNPARGHIGDGSVPCHGVTSLYRHVFQSSR